MTGMHWFRWHHGTVTDQKFQLIARQSNASVAQVLALWASLLEHASMVEDRGCVKSINLEAIGCALGLPDGSAEAIAEQMRQRALVTADGRLAAWEKRQVKREDLGSTDRKRLQRRRESQTASARSDPGHATSRDVTPREEEIREEEISGEESTGEERREKSERTCTTRCRTVEKPADVSDEIWKDWISLRTQHKSGTQAKVIDQARLEARAAGMTLNDFLQEWVYRGYRVLKAEWLNKDRPLPRAIRRNSSTSELIEFGRADPHHVEQTGIILDAVPRLAS